MTSLGQSVANEFRALVEGYNQLQAKLKVSSLTDEERILYELKAKAIGGIFLVLKFLEQKSEKQQLLLRLCLEGGGCTSKDAAGHYKNVDSLRSARDQFRYLLASTLFRSDKVTALLQSNSLYELKEVFDWYQTNVFRNAEFIRRSKGI